MPLILMQDLKLMTGRLIEVVKILWKMKEAMETFSITLSIQ